MDIPMRSIQFEISGVCNARCPYCITGQRNMRREKTGNFVDPDRFQWCIETLLTKHLIDCHTCVALFNYGEPFLHPKFGYIIDILETMHLPYEISTNASIMPDEDVLKKMSLLQTIQFSTCGCSQNSYDRIHGFSYPRVRENIRSMCTILHKYHPDVECILKLQMYRFNEHEYRTALAFAQNNEMNVIPLHAIYANLEQQINFVEKYTETDVLPEESEQLWYYLPDLIKMSAPKKCPQWNSMVIDENLNVALCCMVTKLMKEYRLSDVESASISVLESREGNALCKRCLSSGAARSICMTPSYKKDLPYEEILAGHYPQRTVLVGEGALAESFRIMYPRYGRIRSALMEEVIADGKQNFVVLADQKWWKYLSVLKSADFLAGQDYLVYHTYLR